MSEHLASADLEALVQGSLSSQQVLTCLRHLLHCGECQDRLAPLLSASIRDREPVQVLSADEDASYDAAINLAFDSAWRLFRKDDPVREAFELLEAMGPEEFLWHAPRFGDLAVCDAFLERSYALRYEDPRKMLLFSQGAAAVAIALDPERYSAREIADCRCRAYVELANSYRVTDYLDWAERALSRAAELGRSGTQSDELDVRFLDVQASILTDRRQFSKAFPALDAVHEIHLQRGDRHLAGRALVSKGLFKDYEGQPEEAIRNLRKGLTMIDRERDPELVFMATANLARALMGCGKLKEARAVLWPNLGRPDLAGGQIGRLKLVWLEGQINVGLRKLDRAERAFLKAKQGFEEANLPYKASQVSLDLAAVWIRQGRDEEARNIVLAAAEIFSSLRIHRELMVAVFFLKKIFETRVATLEALEEVKKYLEDAEHAPNAWFDPPPIG